MRDSTSIADAPGVTSAGRRSTAQPPSASATMKEVMVLVADIYVGEKRTFRLPPSHLHAKNPDLERGRAFLLAFLPPFTLTVVAWPRSGDPRSATYCRSSRR